MLENPIPFFVLQSVFELFSSIDDSHSLNSVSNFDSMSQNSYLEKSLLPYLLLTFLKHENETLPLPDADQSFDHLLDFYHCCKTSQKYSAKPRKNLFPFKLRPKNEFPLISSSIKKSRMHSYLQMIVNRELQMVPRATDLENAGVTFRKAESNRGFIVNFSHGELEIPYILVEEETRPQLMNLIAFEQSSDLKETPLTSYAVLMDCIVKTPRDVQILQQHKIIENKLADENAVAQFFNQLRYCPYLDYVEHHMAVLLKNVTSYCDSRWQKFIAKLYRDYFSNPWSIIPFIPANILLFLSTLQTLYSILSYHLPSTKKAC
ncbi:hypothetical protein LUZ62_062736 [Rhynchospora pubera]|uniref:Uncharacterized protein n=1 Tax=Rhynchospora pubera TaxID=906938 RepID=A0AAV8EGV2_9POAL|nr:hypothetical protein LUZ62_062736 [Rhynchospora pubera]